MEHLKEREGRVRERCARALEHIEIALAVEFISIENEEKMYGRGRRSVHHMYVEGQSTSRPLMSMIFNRLAVCCRV